MTRQFFVGGNFKMNGTLDSVKGIVDSLNKADLDPKVEVVIAPSFPHLLYVKEHVKSKRIAIASQTVSERPNGAYTGEVSVSQVKDVGATWAIIGHSERRHVLKETSEVIADKTKYALDNGLGVILCIGELIEEKKAGKTMQVNEKQLAPVLKLVKDWSKVVIAYEPVWAIGTGLAATPEDAQEIQKALRDHLASKLGKQTAESLRILYGGSVNGKNATSFRDKPDIDGFLVGGASLKPEFIDIINSRR